MVKKNQNLECLILRIGDKELNNSDDDKILASLGSLIYFPYEELEENDLEEVNIYFILPIYM